MFGNSFLFWRLLWKVITWLFILSIPWEYFRLYRHQVAEQFTHSMKVSFPEGVDNTLSNLDSQQLRNINVSSKRQYA